MASNDKDLYLKIYVSSILRHIGYVVFQEVDLSTYSYQPTYQRKQITDFDVLGVLIEADFSNHIVVTECKSMEDKAMENLLKLNGVKNFFGADKAYFVQKKIDMNAREVGKDLGIWVFDEMNITNLIKNLEVPDSCVEVEKKIYASRLSLLNKIKNTHKGSKIKDYLRFDFWTLPEHRNIINLLRLLEQYFSTTDLRSDESKYLSYQALTSLTYAISRFVNKIIRHNLDNVKEGVVTNILGGSRDRRDKEALFDTISKLVPDSRLSAYPLYVDQLSELVKRYINSPRDSSQVVACIDSFTRKHLLRGSTENNHSCQYPYNSKVLKLARDTAIFVTSVSNGSEDIYAELLEE